MFEQATPAISHEDVTSLWAVDDGLTDASSSLPTESIRRLGGTAGASISDA